MAINHPGMDGSMDLGFGPDPQRASFDNSEQRDGAGNVTLSADQFEALMNRVSGAQERDYASQLGDVVQLEQQELPQAGNLPLDLSSLPNPAHDPDGFRQGLEGLLGNARQELISVAQNSAQSHVRQTSVLDDAWNLMKENYAEVAEHTDLVQLAATREMESLRQRGLDPMQVIAHNPSGYVDSVARRAQLTINKVRGLSETESDEHESGVDRTDLLSGGGPRPGMPKPAAAKTSNLVDELKVLQRELGIY